MLPLALRFRNPSHGNSTLDIRFIYISRHPAIALPLNYSTLPSLLPPSPPPSLSRRFSLRTGPPIAVCCFAWHPYPLLRSSMFEKIARAVHRARERRLLYRSSFYLIRRLLASFYASARPPGDVNASEVRRYVVTTLTLRHMFALG